MGGGRRGPGVRKARVGRCFFGSGLEEKISSVNFVCRHRLALVITSMYAHSAKEVEKVTHI